MCRICRFWCRQIYVFKWLLFHIVIHLNRYWHWFNLFKKCWFDIPLRCFGFNLIDLYNFLTIWSICMIWQRLRHIIKPINARIIGVMIILLDNEIWPHTYCFFIRFISLGLWRSEGFARRLCLMQELVWTETMSSYHFVF